MIGFVPVAAALTILAGKLDLNANFTVETRAGEAPVITGQPPEPSLVGVATPGAEIQYLDERVDLRLRYDLRIFWRDSSADPNPAPLLLHTASLTLDAHPTRRLQTKLAATVVEGAADYTYLPLIFGESQAALVVVPQIFSASLAGTAELRASRIVTPEIAVQASHSQPVGETEALAPTTNGPPVTDNLPHYSLLSGVPGVAFRVSHVDDLTVATALEYQYVSGISSPSTTATLPLATHSLSAYTAIPTLAARRRLGLHGELDLRVGLALTHLLSSSPVESNSVTPVGRVAFDDRLVSLRDTILGARVEALVDYYLDPVLGTPAPHAIATTGLVLGLPLNWSIGLQGTFSTTLKAHPLGTPPTVTYPDEVIASAALPVRHALSDDFAIEFGGRWADRGPFFTAPDFGFHQRQLWLYVSLTGSSRPTRVVAVAPPLVP